MSSTPTTRPATAPSRICTATITGNAPIIRTDPAGLESGDYVGYYIKLLVEAERREKEYHNFIQFKANSISVADFEDCDPLTQSDDSRKEFSKGCVGLAALRNGYSGLPWSAPYNKVFRDFEHAKSFLTQTLQDDYVGTIVAIQFDTPLSPAEQAGESALPGEVTREQFSAGSHFNFATMIYTLDCKRRWEYVTHGWAVDKADKTTAVVKRRESLPEGFKHAIFAVVYWPKNSPQNPWNCNMQLLPHLDRLRQEGLNQ